MDLSRSTILDICKILKKKYNDDLISNEKLFGGDKSHLTQYFKENFIPKVYASFHKRQHIKNIIHKNDSYKHFNELINLILHDDINLNYYNTNINDGKETKNIFFSQKLFKEGRIVKTKENKEEEFQIFFENYHFRYEEIKVNISNNFIDNSYWEKILQEMIVLKNYLSKEKNKIIFENYRLIENINIAKEKTPIILSKDFSERFDKICEKLKDELIKNANESNKEQIKFVEESLIRIKFFYTFFEKMIELIKVFDNNSKTMVKKYKEIAFFKNLALKSELHLQDCFLEYNENIDNIILSIDDKNAMDENLINKPVRKDTIGNIIQNPWNKDFEFYKFNFIRYNQNTNFNFFKKYGMMKKEHLIEKYVNKLCSLPAVPKDGNKNYFEFLFQKKWIEINSRTFDRLQKKKLRIAILEDNYHEIYKIIKNYENISGKNDSTKKIKQYAIFHIINNNVVKKKFL